MSHLSRRYTNFFYVVDENGKMKQVTCMSSRLFREMFPMATVPGANGVFPCEHESRGFLSSKGKKHNHTHSRMKRRRKSRIRARRAF